MKVEEILKKSDSDIDKEIETLRKKSLELQIKLSTEKVKDVSVFGKLKKDIARLKTVKNNRREEKDGPK